MTIFLETKRQSVKCHRHKCLECKNVSKLCGCMCHRVIELIRDSSHDKRSQLRIIARKKIKQKICGHCFCLFKLNRGNRIYCNKKCYLRANRIKHLHKRIIEIQAQIQKLTATGGFE